MGTRPSISTSHTTKSFLACYFSPSFERLIGGNEMADWINASALFSEHFPLANFGVWCTFG